MLILSIASNRLRSTADGSVAGIFFQCESDSMLRKLDSTGLETLSKLKVGRSPYSFLESDHHSTWMFFASPVMTWYI